VVSAVYVAHAPLSQEFTYAIRPQFTSARYPAPQPPDHLGRNDGEERAHVVGHERPQQFIATQSVLHSAQSPNPEPEGVHAGRYERSKKNLADAGRHDRRIEDDDDADPGYSPAVRYGDPPVQSSYECRRDDFKAEAHVQELLRLVMESSRDEHHSQRDHEADDRDRVYMSGPLLDLDRGRPEQPPGEVGHHQHPGPDRGKDQCRNPHAFAGLFEHVRWHETQAAAAWRGQGRSGCVRSYDSFFHSTFSLRVRSF